MKIISTYNEYHLGDNLIHLNYLSRLCRVYPEVVFIHYLNKEYISQLKLLIPSDQNIILEGLESKDNQAINSWIGYKNYFYNSPLAHDWVNFHLDFFQYFSSALGLVNPIVEKKDLLFDFPKISEPSPINRNFDFLIVNSTPLSGQTSNFNTTYLTELTKQLVFKGYSVITTHPTGIVESTLEKGLNLLEISQISNRSQAIIGIPNGPMWLTFNIYNLNRIMFRIMWLSIQKLELGNNCISCVDSKQITDLLLSNKII